MPHLSITRLRLRRFWFVPAFLRHAQSSITQVRGASGFIMGYTAYERPLAFWTVTIWKDAASKTAYYTSGVHREAMPRLLHWCDEASVASVEIDDTDVSPSEAARTMKCTGRLSKVRHPSQAQSEKRIWPSGRVPLGAGRITART